MAGALGKFLEWADQNAIRGEIGPDGKIRAIKSDELKP
jgi:hypothetical protein